MRMKEEMSRRVRPWTQGPPVRQRRDKLSISLPTVDLYGRHMDHVQTLHERLRLAEQRRSVCLSPRSSSSLLSLQAPRMTRSHTFAAVSTISTNTSDPISAVKQFQEEQPCEDENETDPQHGEVDHHHADYHEQEKRIIDLQNQSSVSYHIRRYSAYSYPLSSDQAESIKYVARKYAWTKSKPYKNGAHARKSSGKDDEASSSGVSSVDENDLQTKERVQPSNPPVYEEHKTGHVASQKDPVDILQLCEHLRTKGLGDPVLSIHSHKGPQRNSLPPGVKARCLPRNPSSREKIKGRARLDQELANLKAMAFCEQQRPRVFRTASADLKNRDMRLLEEEERENVQRDVNAAQAGLGDENLIEDEDDESSLVGSPLSREELFLRIEAWAEDVNNALNRGHAEAHG